MNGPAKTHRGLRLAAWHCTHPDIDGTDKALLAYLADYASQDGRSAHPGNRNIADALGLRDSATDVRIAKNIRLGLIERTERANGRNKASSYRLCLESQYYPDESVGGEKLVTKPRRQPESVNEKPPGIKRADCELVEAAEAHGLSRAVNTDKSAQLDDENRPVCEPKPPGQNDETARSRPTTNKYTSNTQPPPTTESNDGGRIAQDELKDGLRKEFMISLPPEMHTAVLGNKQKAIIEAQLIEYGPEKLSSAIWNWVRNRDLPVAGLQAKWAAWLVEGPEYLKLTTDAVATDKTDIDGDAIRWLFNRYLAVVNRDPKTCLLTPQRELMLRERLAETVQMKGTREAAVNFMARCVEAMSESDWHMGRNPKTQGRAFCELENCFARDKFPKWVAAVERQENPADDGADD